VEQVGDFLRVRDPVELEPILKTLHMKPPLLGTGTGWHESHP